MHGGVRHHLWLFPVFCLGTFLAGWWGSFVQSYRFAATDAASDPFKPRAISWIMVGGFVAGSSDRSS